MRITIAIWCVLLSAVIYVLFQVKYEVQFLARDLAETKRQLKEEKASIKVLNAEWTYLNQPSRLRELANRHLQLGPISNIQVVDPIDLKLYISSSADDKKPINLVRK